MKMTTQQKLDCLLKQFDTLAQHQGDGVVLNENDVRILMKQCGFANTNEIAFLYPGAGRKRSRERGLCGRQHHSGRANHHRRILPS